MRKSIKQSLSNRLPGRSDNAPSTQSSSRQQPSAAKDGPNTTQNPTAIEILQYRYHYGVNLGAVYVLERWLCGSAFPPGTTDAQSSELEAVKAWTRQIGIDATRKKYENRWRSAVSTADWAWLSDTAHCTTIRLPIGYFTLGPAFCANTTFEKYSEVYVNAWASVRSFVSQARSRSVGVLLDLHALPGGANKAEHSGTNSNVASLWDSKKNLSLARNSLVFIAKEISSGLLDGVVGLQICNEAEWDAPGLYEFYDSVISAVSAIDPTIPLYISDAWDLSRAIAYVKRKNKFASGDSPTSNPICIDTHKYFCFTDNDKSPQQILASVPKQLSELNGQSGSVLDSGAAAVVVGEWSCTLSGETWSKLEKGGDRNRSTGQFGQAQCQRWLEKAGGSYFWTYKMDWMDGGDWGFVEQTKLQNISAPRNLIMPSVDVKGAISSAEAQRDARARQSYDDHVNYWTHTDPSGQYEHWRFQNGWSVGWNDALVFFSARANGLLQVSGVAGGDKIGLLELWVRKRIGDSGMVGSLVWEYETGLRKGMSDFYNCVGV